MINASHQHAWCVLETEQIQRCSARRVGMKLDGYDFFLLHAVDRPVTVAVKCIGKSRHTKKKTGACSCVNDRRSRIIGAQIECGCNVIGIVNDPPEIHVRSFERPESGIHIILNARSRCQEIDQLEIERWKVDHRFDMRRFTSIS